MRRPRRLGWISSPTSKIEEFWENERICERIIVEFNNIFNVWTVISDPVECGEAFVNNIMQDVFEIQQDDVVVVLDLFLEFIMHRAIAALCQDKHNL